MAKLKKLLLFKRFFITVPKSHFLQKPPRKARLVEIKDDRVSFWTDKKESKKYQGITEEVIIVDQLQVLSKWLFFKHTIGLFCLVFLSLMFISSNFFIREIVFADENLESAEVYRYVCSHLKSFGPVYVLKSSVSELSQNLRETYSCYAWIGVTRNGGKLIIDIEKEEAPKPPIEDLTQKGDLVASKEGIVKRFYVKRGVVLVFKDQAVKPGQVLVSGNLKFHNNERAMDNYVRASGIVIAQTLTVETIEVPKEIASEEYTGKVRSTFVFFLGTKPVWMHKNPFALSFVKEQPLFRLGSVFSFARISYFEKAWIKNVYDETSALSFAQSQVIARFENRRTHPSEQLQKIQVLTITENPESFSVKILVQAEENIVSFAKVN
jgi:sporulation protein YqfD